MSTFAVFCNPNCNLDVFRICSGTLSASATYSSILGGDCCFGPNVNCSALSTIISGNTALICSPGFYNTIIGGIASVIVPDAISCCAPFYNTIGNGCNHYVSGKSNTIVNGHDNIIMSNTCFNTILGGANNCTVGTAYSSVNNGAVNNNFGSFSGVSGYCNAVCDGQYNDIMAGCSNTVCNCYHNSIGGGNFNNISNGACFGFIGNGVENSASAYGSVIGGGVCNSAAATFSIILGGGNSTVSCCNGGVFSGHFNCVCADTSVIAGGHDNKALNVKSFVGGGRFNATASGCYSSVIGGQNNVSNFCYSSALGGINNVNNSSYSANLGGTANLNNHNYTALFGCGLSSVVSNTLHVACINAINTPSCSPVLPLGTVYTLPATTPPPPGTTPLFLM